MRHIDDGVIFAASAHLVEDHGGRLTIRTAGYAYWGQHQYAAKGLETAIWPTVSVLNESQFLALAKQPRLIGASAHTHLYAVRKGSHLQYCLKRGAQGQLLPLVVNKHIENALVQLLFRQTEGIRERLCGRAK